MAEELNKKIIVTGGAGFIGGYLVKNLLSHGYTNITVVDIKEPKTPGVKFVQADFNNDEVMAELIKDTKYVFHLAAMIGVDNCRLHPDDVHTVNCTNTKKFIDLCVKSGVERFIFSSSSEVYGNSKDLPYREDGTPAPISMYAKCKVEVEGYLKKIADTTNMTVGVVRFFNIYGAGQKKDFVVSIFVDRALKNEPLTILGDGTQSRCFTYVENAVEGVYQVFKYTGSKFDVFNIGNPKEEYNMNQLADLVLKSVPNSTSKIAHEGYGNDIRDASYEILRRVPATEKAKNILGFVATTTLQDGLSQVIQAMSTEHA